MTETTGTIPHAAERLRVLADRARALADDYDPDQTRSFQAAVVDAYLASPHRSQQRRYVETARASIRYVLQDSMDPRRWLLDAGLWLDLAAAEVVR